MDSIRRRNLQVAGGAGLWAAMAAAGLMPAGEAAAQAADVAAAFSAKTLADTYKALGAGTPTTSADIVINAPDIAENGAVVPVGVTSKIPNTQEISLLVEKNPNAMTGRFTLLEGAEPEVNMRVKMGQSSDVYAVVKAGDKWFVAKKEIKVTLGGCGG